MKTMKRMKLENRKTGKTTRFFFFIFLIVKLTRETLVESRGSIAK